MKPIAYYVSRALKDVLMNQELLNQFPELADLDIEAAFQRDKWRGHDPGIKKTLAHEREMPRERITLPVLLDRLERVKQRGPQSWLARCPAHEDRTPSLSIRETADGTLLIHCFTGCAVADIVHAIGLELSDLFPPKDSSSGPLRRNAPTIPWRDVIRSLRRHLTVIAIAAADIKAGKPLSDKDINAVGTAYHFILEAIERVDHVG